MVTHAKEFHVKKLKELRKILVNYGRRYSAAQVLRAHQMYQYHLERLRAIVRYEKDAKSVAQVKSTSKHSKKTGSSSSVSKTSPSKSPEHHSKSPVASKLHIKASSPKHSQQPVQQRRINEWSVEQSPSSLQNHANGSTFSKRVLLSPVILNLPRTSSTSSSSHRPQPQALSITTSRTSKGSPTATSSHHQPPPLIVLTEAATPRDARSNNGGWQVSQRKHPNYRSPSPNTSTSKKSSSSSSSSSKRSSPKTPFQSRHQSVVNRTGEKKSLRASVSTKSTPDAQRHSHHSPATSTSLSPSKRKKSTHRHSSASAGSIKTSDRSSASSRKSRVSVLRFD